MARLLFRPREAFEPSEQAYRLLPFRFMRWSGDKVLVTNEVGEYQFLPTAVFDRLTRHRLSAEDEAYADLKSKHFLAEGDARLAVDLTATKVRTKRSFLTGFTRLHIFVTTLRCDHTCAYCQVSRVTENRTRFDMSIETADKALDWVFQSPAKELKIEFQGGEPTLNWAVIEHVVITAQQRGAADGRDVQFVIASNLSQISAAMLAFCRERAISLSTSLDGPRDLHNGNRPRPGQDSYQRFATNLALAREALGRDKVSALMTTTPASLDRVVEIVDEYLALGFDSIFLRPISPYGFATKTRLDRAYGAEHFLDFYRAGLDYIIELNRRGVPFVETYAQILLRKMLTPFPVGYVDLQSPAGAGIGVLVYNYDGDVYASDEGRMLAEMGDRSFRLGNLAQDGYRDVMGGDRVQALVDNSILECLPGCSSCAYAPYCGADPTFNWATQGDIVGHRPTSDFCARQMGIIRYLFERLESGDPFVARLLFAWAAQ